MLGFHDSNIHHSNKIQTKQSFTSKVWGCSCCNPNNSQQHNSILQQDYAAMAFSMFNTNTTFDQHISHMVLVQAAWFDSMAHGILKHPNKYSTNIQHHSIQHPNSCNFMQLIKNEVQQKLTNSRAIAAGHNSMART
jgi:hypothetical protein